MNRAIGFIDCNYHVDGLQTVAKHRPVGAVPFGGRYRLLDFVLSSMVNSGIRNVGLVTPSHYRSIVDHLGAGKEWFLDRKTGGLFLLPSANEALASARMKFSLRDMQANIEFFSRDFAEQVVISGCNQVFNMNFQRALEFQHPIQADAVLLYQATPPWPDSPGELVLDTDAEGRVKKISPAAFAEATLKQERPGEQGKRFLEVLILRRRLLMEIIAGSLGESTDLMSVIGENLSYIKVYAYPHLGYWASIDSVANYFRHNLELLDPKIREELFMGKDRILTKIKDSPPAKYGSAALVSNCLIASGSHIEGRVEGSIIFRRVHIQRGAQLKNAVVMQGSAIGKDAVLENVILDKFVRVKDQTILRGTRTHPLVLSKGSVV